MPVCIVCNTEKENAAFNRNSRGRLHSYCRECSRVYGRRYYQANKTYYLEKAKRRNTRQREILQPLLDAAKDKPCADCGVKYPPWIMQFDHLDGSEKIANLSDMKRWAYATNTVLAEIAKCEVVCANCHCQRTHERLMKARSNGENTGEHEKPGVPQESGCSLHPPYR